MKYNTIDIKYIIRDLQWKNMVLRRQVRNDMTEPTVEAVFGVDAGIVWESLNKIGPSTIGDIVKASGMRPELVYGALGWLGRENKIAIERRGRAMVFSLLESEARWGAVKGTTIGDSVPQGQSKHRRSMSPKKAPKARKVKASTATPEKVKKALVYILSEFEENREPTTRQVSSEVGLDSRQLGKALSRLDIKSKSIRQGGKSVRICPLESKARAWELAALDAEGLQKMSEARERAIEDDKEQDRENLTVFD